MNKLLFMQMQIFGFLSIASADHILQYVQPGENVTLDCNITSDYDLHWYRQTSDELKQLISGLKGQMDKDFSQNYNVNESHFGITSGRASLVIIGVTEEDLGFYYCSTPENRTHRHFGKAIRLGFAEKETHKEILTSAGSDSSWYIILILIVVCSVSILIHICMAVSRCSKQATAYTDCNSRTTQPAIKSLNLQYANFVPAKQPERDMSPNSDTVTYATVR